MQSRHERAPDLARGLAALVLALFALGWWCDRAHVAYESHGYCAEHQRVEHASVAHAHDGHHEHDGPLFDAHDRGADEHAACCILLGRADDPLAPPAAFACDRYVPLAAERAHPRADAERARDSVPRLALAPKQSPPAA